MPAWPTGERCLTEVSEAAPDIFSFYRMPVRFVHVEELMATQEHAIRQFKQRSHAINLQSLLRLSMPMFVPLYCAAFNWSYVTWISPIWGYLGPTYKSPNAFLMIVGYLLAVFISTLSPLRINRVSQVIYWLLYFTVYIPGLFVPLFMQLDSGLTLLLLQLTMTSGMLIIALSYRLRLLNLRRYELEPPAFWAAFSVLFLLCNLALFIVFRGSIHLSSLAQVYSTRSSAARVLQENAGISYVAVMLSNVLNPFLIAYGLTAKRRDLVVLGVMGQIFVYATAAMKSVIISPLVIIAFYFSIRKDRGGWVPKLCLAVASMFFVLTALVLGERPGPIYDLASATLVRGFALPGVFVGQYQYFFENFPHTHLAHIHGVNLLLANPYEMQLGQEMGAFYVGTSQSGGVMDANANFFAFDGIAGFGLPGIPIMGVICAGMFWLIDSSARKHSLSFASAALTMSAISLANASLFTSFLGGGFLFWILCFLVMPHETLEGRPT